jgi:hypothetical protein
MEFLLPEMHSHTFSIQKALAMKPVYLDSFHPQQPDFNILRKARIGSVFTAIPQLTESMKPFLNFHTLTVWRGVWS